MAGTAGSTDLRYSCSTRLLPKLVSVSHVASESPNPSHVDQKGAALLPTVRGDVGHDILVAVIAVAAIVAAILAAAFLCTPGASTHMSVA